MIPTNSGFTLRYSLYFHSNIGVGDSEAGLGKALFTSIKGIKHPFGAEKQIIDYFQQRVPSLANAECAADKRISRGQ